MDTFYWHDYETFGTNPRSDRPAQFAGQRTDAELSPIGEPLVIYCQPTADYLPHPEACLVTGITPQIAQSRGVSEPEFAAAIHDQLATPGTCTAGYNSIRFDDEVSRHLFYRNFFEPYAREWQHGNSRWDLIDVMRLCYALRPAGIEWPSRPDGAPSFRLEDLTAANGLDHQSAHDALSDVAATIALARRLRSAQPRLFDYCLRLRDKRFARQQLDFLRLQPVLHASGKFHSERGGLAMAVPLCEHPSNRNGIVVYDLNEPPEPLLKQDAETIRSRVFVRSADLADGISRIPLKTIHVNRAPVLAPLSVLKGVDAARIQLNLEACQRHLEQIRQADGLASKVREVFSATFDEPDRDADGALYDGLIAPSDQQLARQWRSSGADALRELSDQFQDPRLRELAWRYRARWLPDALNEHERTRWQQQRGERLESQAKDFFQRLQALSESSTGKPEAVEILHALRQWASQLGVDPP